MSSYYSRVAGSINKIFLNLKVLWLARADFPVPYELMIFLVYPLYLCFYTDRVCKVRYRKKTFFTVQKFKKSQSYIFKKSFSSNLPQIYLYLRKNCTFCVSRKSYYSLQNRLKEAITVFASITNSPWFARASMVLFLNKRDLFQNKLQAGKSIRSVFADYRGRRTTLQTIYNNTYFMHKHVR
jgi:hypothetical protein